MSQSANKMQDSQPLLVLLNCLHNHDIIVSRKELEKAINTEQGRAMEKWIDTHVGPDTLLTKQELSLYLALQGSGEQMAFDESQDLSLVRGVNDHEFQSAIEELNRSTALVEKEIEALRIQQEAMTSVLKRNRDLRDARTATDRKQSKLWTVENANASSVVDERIQSLDFQMTEIESQCKAADVGLRNTAIESLRTDDKLLSGLQNLAGNLEPMVNIDDNAAQRVRDLCTRLIKCTVEAVRARLDRVYIDTINATRHVTEGVPFTNNSEVTALLDELESLHTEILPVAQMSTEQQYLAPALHLIALENCNGRERAKRAIKYVSHCLSEIISGLEDLNTRARNFENYRRATTTLTTIIKSELNWSYPTSPKAKSSSPSRVRKPNKPISPIRPRNTRRRSSGTSFDDEINPEQQLFRNLGLSLHVDPNGDRFMINTLKDLLADRKTKLNGHAKALQEASESSIGSHLYDLQVTLQLLTESLHSETTYGGINLLNREIDEALSNLKNGIEEVRREISAVDLEIMRERSFSKDELLERWIR